MRPASAAAGTENRAPLLLELRGITKDFPGVRALDGVSFDLARGEIHALCGENGAGKSTLIKILCGLFPAGSYGGEVRLAGRPIRLRNVHAAEAHGIALIAQELALVPELSVEENIVLGREPARFGIVHRERMRGIAQDALERVGVDLDPARPVRALGIAQQQMVEIAKAIAKRAAILVLDEPTAALAGPDAERLLALLVELRGQGVASILVSHRLDEVFQVADRITVLRDGRSIETAPAAAWQRDQVIRSMVGREVEDLYPRAPEQRTDVLLAVRDWRLDDGANPGRRVLEGVEFELRAGEVLGVAGLMGAGRTALLSSLYGAARSRVQGELRLMGGAPRGPFSNPAAALEQGVALVSEDRKRYGIVAEGSILDNLTLSTLQDFARRGLLDARARRRACAGHAASLGLRAPDLEARALQLSGGNQQKVVLGRGLMVRPRILLLDEPTRGIDVGAKAEIYRLVVELARQGMGILLVTSDLPELLGLCHRILVLSQGCRTALFEGEVSAEAVMRAATLGGRASTQAEESEIS